MNRFAIAAASFFLIAGPSLLRAAPTAVAEYSQHFAGEARVGTEAPMPVHLEIRRNGTTTDGVISTPAEAFKLVDMRGVDTLTGRLSGDGVDGTITLRISGDNVEGSFELAGQTGTLRARRTMLDAAAALKPPDQTLDLTPVQWAEDLDRLMTILTTEHGNPYTHVSRTALQREADRVRAELPALSDVQVALHFRRLGAMIGDGHTSVDLPRKRPRYPLEMFLFEDGLRVIAAPSGHRDLLGARLVAIDGKSTAQLLNAIRDYVGQHETEWGFRNVAPYLLDRADLLDAIGLGSARRRIFRYEFVDRSTKDVPLDAVVDRPQTVPLGGTMPTWLRNPDLSFWYERLTDGSIYLNWRGYDDLAANSAKLLTSIDGQRPPKLIIDLRDNGGGDFNKGRAFIERIRTRPWLNRKGVLFVLLGRQAFSAAMTNAVDFKKTTEATLIGEPPGAAPNNWQEVRFFHLPNSQLRVGVSTQYYSFLPGVTTVQPDIVIPPAPDDWRMGPDRAVQYALSLPTVQ